MVIYPKPVLVAIHSMILLSVASPLIDLTLFLRLRCDGSSFGSYS